MTVAEVDTPFRNILDVDSASAASDKICNPAASAAPLEQWPHLMSADRSRLRWIWD